MKPRGPGRKGSVKKEAFKGDALVGGVSTTFEEQQAGKTSAEATKELEEEAEKLTIAAEADKKEREEAVAAQAAAAELEQKARIEAQEKARVAAVAAAEAQEKAKTDEAEQVKIAKQQAQLEQQRAAREEEEAAAAAAAQQRAKAKAAAMAEAEAEAAANAEREEQQKRAAREEAALRQQQEDEAAEQREQEEVLAAIERQKAALRAQQEQEAREAAQAEQREREELERQARARQEQARQAAEKLSEKELAELAEKQRKAEEKRRKRAMFLSDMDNFSADFQSKSEQAEAARRRAAEEHEAALTREMRERSGQFVAPTVASGSADAGREEEERDARQVQQQREEEARLAALDAAAAQRMQRQREAAAVDDSTTPPPVPDAGKMNALTSSLFSGGASSASTASADGTALPVSDDDASFLRVPTRIGSKAITSAGGRSKTAAVAEDEEEEGTGGADSISNILTLEERRTMTSAQKANWKAKQGDLSSRRKDFHGVVTLAFEGIFSWQMYGSADAIDEGGNPYTEYLMRCQWGTTFDNMQPWIVAHRYKEFDTLDGQIRRMFPSMIHNMPNLPEKDYFNYLNSGVIAKRRSCLEEYMSKIVLSMPSILRSELFDAFLGIKERLVVIKRKLADMGLLSTTPGADLDFITVQTAASSASSTVAAPPRVVDLLGHDGSVTSGGKDRNRWATTGDEELGTNKDSSADAGAPKEKLTFYSTAEQAEKAKEEMQCVAMDSDSLGHLEEDIRTLGVMLRRQAPRELTAKESAFRQLLLRVSSRWPMLRATAVVGADVDFALIPRAMQAEEDLQAIINDFRSAKSIADAQSRV